MFPLEVRRAAPGSHVVADISFGRQGPSWVECTCGARTQGRPETIAEWFRLHRSAPDRQDASVPGGLAAAGADGVRHVLSVWSPGGARLSGG